MGSLGLGLWAEQVDGGSTGGVGAADGSADVFFVSSKAESAFGALKRGLHERVPGEQRAEFGREFGREGAGYGGSVPRSSLPTV